MTLRGGVRFPRWPPSTSMRCSPGSGSGPTAVKHRPLPPVAGEERQQFIAQAQVDFQDFAIIGDADGSIEDGVLVLRVDLRSDTD